MNEREEGRQEEEGGGEEEEEEELEEDGISGNLQTLTAATIIVFAGGLFLHSRTSG